jgi:hypothetical protein
MRCWGKEQRVFHHALLGEGTTNFPSCAVSLRKEQLIFHHALLGEGTTNFPSCAVGGRNNEYSIMRCWRKEQRIFLHALLEEGTTNIPLCAVMEGTTNIPSCDREQKRKARNEIGNPGSKTLEALSLDITPRAWKLCPRIVNLDSSWS